MIFFICLTSDKAKKWYPAFFFCIITSIQIYIIQYLMITTACTSPRPWSVVYRQNIITTDYEFKMIPDLHHFICSIFVRWYNIYCLFNEMHFYNKTEILVLPTFHFHSTFLLNRNIEMSQIESPNSAMLTVELNHGSKVWFDVMWPAKHMNDVHYVITMFKQFTSQTCLCEDTFLACIII